MTLRDSFRAATHDPSVASAEARPDSGSPAALGDVDMTLQYGVTLTAASVTKLFEERASVSMNNERKGNVRSQKREAAVRFQASALLAWRRQQQTMLLSMLKV